MYTLPRTHKKVKMLTISSKPVFTKCKNVRKTKIEPYETCTTATFSLPNIGPAFTGLGVLLWELRHVIPSGEPGGREGEIEPWVSVPYDFNV